MPGTDRFDELAAELDRLTERLADAAMDVLRAGLEDGSDEAAALATERERLVNRARSAVEKAAALLAAAASSATAPATGGGRGRGRPATGDGPGRAGRPGDDEEWDAPAP
ncbi:MAG TPA: hypothetical protein VEH29_13255 [Acidimicrobiales bacterium]|nr:hypothetical protein [Acidimicrobiales bacterium]